MILRDVVNVRLAMPSKTVNVYLVRTKTAYFVQQIEIFVKIAWMNTLLVVKEIASHVLNLV